MKVKNINKMGFISRIYKNRLIYFVFIVLALTFSASPLYSSSSSCPSFCREKLRRRSGRACAAAACPGGRRPGRTRGTGRSCARAARRAWPALRATAPRSRTCGTGSSPRPRRPRTWRRHRLPPPRPSPRSRPPLPPSDTIGRRPARG